jgi:hypothetical protein
LLEEYTMKLMRFPFFIVLMSMLALVAFGAQASPVQPFQNIEIVDPAFEGRVTINELRFDFDENQFLASGVIRGRNLETGTRVNEAFENEAIDYRVIQPNSNGEELIQDNDNNEEEAALLQVNGNNTCPILLLDFGGLFLDVLGLELTITEFEIIVEAVAGPGRLLGNLLCALVGLLDPQGPFLELPGIENIVNALLDAINDLL